jgi:hypothetical protein
MVFKDTVFSATLRSIIRLVGLRDRAFKPVDSVTEDEINIGLFISSLLLYLLLDALGARVYTGTTVSWRARAGRGIAEAGLRMARPRRGVAFRSAT